MVWGFRRVFIWLVTFSICAQLSFLTTAKAMEVDSFTAPPQPLGDIGALVSSHVYSKLPGLMDKLNSKLQHQKNLRFQGRITGRTSFISYKFDPSYLLSQNEGWGLPETFIELWLNYSRSIPSTDRFSSPFNHSAYRGIHSPVPLATTVIAPVVNMYGIYIGTDKLGHFLQQGYEYYLVYLQAITAGQTENEALAAAVHHGTHQEDSYYGTTLSGIRSNGDLSANFSGLHFYLSLTHEMTIYGEKVPPALIFQNEQWQLNPARHADQLLRPFITPHMSEAVNPSEFEFNHDILHKAIVARCATWANAVPFVEKGNFNNYDLASWNGLPYGFAVDKEKSMAFWTECPAANAEVFKHFYFSSEPKRN